MPDANLDPDRPFDAIALAIDEARRDVHEALGSRTYRVFVVTRSWSGGVVGDGLPQDTEIELLPRPLVERVARDRLGPAGREHDGDIRLTEVSLRYAAVELQPAPARGQEVGYRLVDTGGQGQGDLWGVIAAEPVSRRGDRRGDNADWYVLLHRSSAFGNLDGASP